MARPQVALVVATAAVAVVIVRLQARPPASSAEALVQDAHLLAALDGAPLEANGDLETLAEELDTWDAMMLAESPATDDETWLEHTLEVLDELNEGQAADPSPTAPEEQLLEELLQLDETDLGIET
jgi:hypothetical protein